MVGQCDHKQQQPDRQRVRKYVKAPRMTEGGRERERVIGKEVEHCVTQAGIQPLGFCIVSSLVSRLVLML